MQSGINEIPATTSHSIALISSAGSSIVSPFKYRFYPLYKSKMSPDKIFGAVFPIGKSD
jgi:hypothetical protein